MIRWLYSLLLLLLLPAIIVRLFYRSLTLKAYRNRISERFAFFPENFEPKPNGLWFHLVSVGETLAAIPLIKKIQQQYPELAITITSTTPTGSEQVSKAFADSIEHMYLPYDFSFLIKKFLKKVKPRLAIFMETELWPNTIASCKDLNVNTWLLNARLSKKSARSYARFNCIAKPMLQSLDKIIAQHRFDAKRFIALGVEKNKVIISGSIKFDIHPPEDVQQQAEQLKKNILGNRFIWLAASTHPGEDEIILAAQQKITNKIPDALLVLVPRHPERTSKVITLLQNKKMQWQRRTAQQKVKPIHQVFILDTLGELMHFYAVADMSVVCGSLLATGGGHNILEPAMLGKPVMTGPYFANFRDIIQRMIKANACKVVADADELAQQIIDWQQHPEQAREIGQAGTALVESNRGSLEKVLAIIKQEMI